MTEVNVPLLRKAVEWAEVEAEKGSASRWDQQWWRFTPTVFVEGIGVTNATCDTCYCIAGYVGTLVNEAYVHSEWDDDGVHVADAAQKALGLTAEQAGCLFRSSNTIEQVREIAEHIAGGAL